ncbi:polysaccharide deacetylase family protein [Actinopolymorpha sp. B11F2]|uniref:polysaccharide deacetylase family protein n=1 Tax=Actinopolymorpha sp. B11F2 TaxID=3160862 RepID=UPI0032E499CC
MSPLRIPSIVRGLLILLLGILLGFFAANCANSDAREGATSTPTATRAPSVRPSALPGRTAVARATLTPVATPSSTTPSTTATPSATAPNATQLPTSSASPNATGSPGTSPSPTTSASPSVSPTPGTASPTPKPGPVAQRVDRIEDTSAKIMFLTFDDGPSVKYTPQILRILAKYKAPATFFALGDASNANPDIVKQIRAAGHTIGNHTHDHKSLPSLSDEDAREELQKGPASRCFRPPYGAINDDVRAIAADLRQEVVLWHVDPKDWDRPGADKIEERVLKGVAPGAIVLFHDGGGDRSQTVTALERLLPQLIEKGYAFEAMPC